MENNQSVGHSTYTHKKPGNPLTQPLTLVIALGILAILGVGGWFVLNTKTDSDLDGGQNQMYGDANGTNASGTNADIPDNQGGPGNGQNFSTIPEGSTALFGEITAIDGNTLTISQTTPAGGRMRDQNGQQTASPTPSASPTAKVLTVTLTSDTKYTGGSQTDLKVGSRIGGYGTAESDGSITAVEIMVNLQQGRGPQGNQLGGPQTGTAEEKQPTP